MSTIGTLATQVGKFRTASIMTVVYTSLEVLMGVLIPYVTSWIIDRGISAGDMGNVLLYGGIMLIMAALSLFFGVRAGQDSAYASSGFAANLRATMFRKIQSFSFANIDKFSSAGLITRMTTDVSNLQGAFQSLLRISVRSPLNLVTSFLMAVVINGRMSLIFLVALAILGTIVYLVISKTVKLFYQIFRQYDELNGSIEENVRAIRVVKAFVREDFENEKFRKAARGLYKLFVKAESLQALNHPAMMVVVYGCMIALSWFGAHFIVAGDLTTGELTSLFTYVMSILTSLMMLSMVIVTLTMSATNARRVAEVLDEQPSIVSPESDAVDTVKDGSIDFENVCFSYGSGDYAVENVTLRISSGQTVGFVGGTGSGKSTLASLVARLYDVSCGAVRVGGIDVRKYDVDALRNQVSMVLQKNVLFSGTVLDNLRWGDENATPDECRETCRIAQADGFIMQMPDGYDTMITQGGSNVSGGQKQRICIARALLKKPKILILDDSTSACDNATDAAIRRGLASVKGMTKIVIAQRIQSVVDADKIVVMDDGKISGVGTHAELLSSNKIYRVMYEMQTEASGDFDEKKG